MMEHPLRPLLRLTVTGRLSQWDNFTPAGGLRLLGIMMGHPLRPLLRLTVTGRLSQWDNFS
jgi:hypothetical protein